MNLQEWIKTEVAKFTEDFPEAHQFGVHKAAEDGRLMILIDGTIGQVPIKEFQEPPKK